MASFDRGKCKGPLNGPNATGQHCPEGWTLYRSPGPVMRTKPNASGELGADFHYYLWVDQFDTLGLGKDVVILNGTGSDSLLAFEPRSEKWTVIRIPYPLATPVIDTWYIVTVFPAGHPLCGSVDSVFVNELTHLENDSVLTDEVCHGDGTGSIEVITTGNGGPWNYTWTDGGGALMISYVSRCFSTPS